MKRAQPSSAQLVNLMQAPSVSERIGSSRNILHTSHSTVRDGLTLQKANVHSEYKPTIRNQST